MSSRIPSRSLLLSLSRVPLLKRQAPVPGLSSAVVAATIRRSGAIAIAAQRRLAHIIPKPPSSAPPQQPARTSEDEKAPQLETRPESNDESHHLLDAAREELGKNVHQDEEAPQLETRPDESHGPLDPAREELGRDAPPGASFAKSSAANAAASAPRERAHGRRKLVGPSEGIPDEVPRPLPAGTPLLQPKPAPWRIPNTSRPENNHDVKREREPCYQLSFRCMPCDTRSTHTVSKQAYHHGSVLITCPGCRNRHVISDHLRIFGDRDVTVEDLMREKGRLVKRGTLGEDGDIEFWPDERDTVPPNTPA